MLHHLLLITNDSLSAVFISVEFQKYSNAEIMKVFLEMEFDKDGKSPILDATEDIKWSILNQATSNDLKKDKRHVLLELSKD